MIVHALLFELYLSFYVVFAKFAQYNGHSLYQINIKNTGQIEVVNNLVNNLYLDVWSRAFPGTPGFILVAKEDKEVFEIALNAGRVDYAIKVDNIIELLKLEEEQLKAATVKNQRNGCNITFNTIHNYDEINMYLKYLAKTYSYVTNNYAGSSVEGRPIYYLKISTNNFQDQHKPIVMMLSLLHSREWVTSPTTLYAIHKLVVHRAEPRLLESFDWIIVPIANPDGYIFSHEVDRFWRKNRRKGLTASDVCVGVDLNRNFKEGWGTESSFSPCREDFHGGGPFSEPETRAISKIMSTYRSRIALFMDIHSFGSKIMYGYGNGTLPENRYDLHRVGNVMARAIDKVKSPSKPNYEVGNNAKIMYTISGSSVDFSQSLGIPFSYTFELPGYTNNARLLNGFLVDPETISQTSFETWDGIKVGVQFLLDEIKNVFV